MKHIIIILSFFIIGSDVAADGVPTCEENRIEIQCDHERSTIRPQLRYTLNQSLKYCGSSMQCKLDAYQRAGYSSECAKIEVSNK